LNLRVVCLCVTVPGSDVAMRALADTSFKSLEGAVCESTLNGVTDMGFTHMTEIQAKTIPPLLEGRSVSSFDVHLSFVCYLDQ